MRTKERIEKYGIRAYIKMLGAKKVKERGGETALISFYKKKYPKAKLGKVIKPSRQSISMKNYWYKIKQIAAGHKIPIKKARKIFKKERKEGEIRLVKKGRGYQLYLKGIYEYIEKVKPKERRKERRKIKHKKIKKIRKTVESYSKLHKTKTYNRCLNEAINDARLILGGSNWNLVKILKIKWIRFYGRER
jgi:hypothetical protein